MDPAPFFQDVAEGPEDVSSFWVTASDGVRLRVATWCIAATPKGTVLFLPGRTENAEKYGRAADAFCRAGFAAMVIDWRGQGLSDRLAADRMLGHVDRFADYQKDLAAMVEAAQLMALPKPWFLLGHSMGACIGLRAIIEGLPVSACAFTSPLWDINLSLPRRLAAWPFSWAARYVGKGKSFAPGTRGESYVLTTAFEANRLTHDPGMYQYYIRISEALEDQQLGGPSLNWLYEALKETRALSKLPSPNIPCVTFCGFEDSLVFVPAVQERMAHWPKGKLAMLDYARHDILCEAPDIRLPAIQAICEVFSG